MVLHDFNLTYYSSITLGSFSILLFPKLCWHTGLTPTTDQLTFIHFGNSITAIYVKGFKNALMTK